MGVHICTQGFAGAGMGLALPTSCRFGHCTMRKHGGSEPFERNGGQETGSVFVTHPAGEVMLNTRTWSGTMDVHVSHQCI